MNVAVLGGGISGLAAAWQLQKLNHTPTVFETGKTPGGKIKSKRVDGYLLEFGPNTIQSSGGDLDDALSELGLTTARQEANPAGRNRFICFHGTPEVLPLGLGALIRSPLLSGRAKWRLLKEPFIPKQLADESVTEFFTRRLGPEVVTRMIDPFVSGVYAGDPEKLSVAAAFPTLKAMELEGGSLARGGWSRMRSARRAAKRSGFAPRRQHAMYSFNEGLQEIPAVLARELGPHLLLDSPVTDLSALGDRWQVNGDRFDALIATIPVPQWTAVAADVFPSIEVEYATVAVVHLSYPREAVTARTDGFGMLIPAVEKRKILGLLYNSALFPGRAPDGEHLFTIFMGGQRAPNLSREPADLLQMATAETGDLLGITSGTAPIFSHVHVWEQAIPQYGMGHLETLRRLDEFEVDHPTWAFAGNYRRGISVAQAFSSGLESANRLADRL